MLTVMKTPAAWRKWCGIALMALLAAPLHAWDYEYLQPEFLLSDPNVEAADFAAGAEWLTVLDRAGPALWVAPTDAVTPISWASVDLSALGVVPTRVAIAGERIYLSGDELGSLRRLIRDAGAFVVDSAWSAPSPPAGIDASARIADLAMGPGGQVLALIPAASAILGWSEAAGGGWSVALGAPELADASMLAAGPAGEFFVARRGTDHFYRLRSGEAAVRVGEALSGYHALLGVESLAYDAANGRVLVGDGILQGIYLYSPAGELLRTLADSAIAPLPAYISVEPSGAVYAYDLGRRALIRWQAKTGDAGAWAAGGDAFIAHREGDDGEEPSPLGPNYLSPGIIVRQHPLGLRDIDLADLPNSDPVLTGQANHLYFVLRNRNDAAVSGGFIGAWWTRRDGEFRFPEAWSNEGLVALNPFGAERNFTFIDVGELGGSSAGIYGPVIWTPGDALAGDCVREHMVLAKYLNRYEVDEGQSADVLAQVVGDNDVAMRAVEVARPGCVPELDRYEYNDREEHSAALTEGWQFLGNRCPRYITRSLGETYPDFECLHVFEDALVPRITPSQGAEQIWRLSVPDLSLHSRDDEDFYTLSLPDLGDPRWQLDDINTEAVRHRGALQADYEPAAMPECGSVLRQAFGPSGRDNSIYVNVSTELVISVRPVANAVAGNPADLAGEQLRFIDVEAAGPTRPAHTLILSCPRDVHELESVRFALERIEIADPTRARRSQEATGGYEIDVSYISTARRGIPSWARDFGEGRGLGPLPCLPIQIQPGPGLGGFSHAGMAGLPGGFGGNLAGCLGLPGLNRPGLLLPHPRSPGLAGCLADGPGCLELSYFDWAGGLDLRGFSVFADKALSVAVLDETGQVIAQAKSMPISELETGVAMSQQGKKAQPYVLDLSAMKEGTYYFRVEGPAADLVLVPLEGSQAQSAQ